MTGGPGGAGWSVDSALPGRATLACGPSFAALTLRPGRDRGDLVAQRADVGSQLLGLCESLEQLIHACVHPRDGAAQELLHRFDERVGGGLHVKHGS